jgi:hypothetical protein
MKLVHVAVMGVVVFAAIGAGVAHATSGGGAQTILNAPVVTPGVEEEGDTSTFTDTCTNGFEFWQLQLTQGDLVKLTWGVPAAVDTVALWAPGTVDADHSTCLYASGWSGWTSSPVFSDTDTTPATGRVSQTVASADGSYPLLFLNTTGANAGPYSFTATVLHAASLSLPHRSTIDGDGTLQVSVRAPDSAPISDPGLKLTLLGYWSARAGGGERAHTLAHATPTAGAATFSYSLPISEWGKKIHVRVVGAGASYQLATSDREKVKVRVPREFGPALVAATDLRTASTRLRQAIYWAGPRKGSHYEFTRTSKGYAYVRYLPHGVKAGGAPGKHLIVATYPYRGAYAALKKYAHGKVVAGPNGSIHFVLPGQSTSVYVAFPKVNYEIEVYDPKAAVALAVASSGLVTPVR